MTGDGNDNPPQWPTFSQLTGPQTALPATAPPEEFLSQIFTAEVWDLLVAETNRYARHKIHTTPLSHRGTLSTWHDTCREEMMVFIGLILATGITHLPDIKEYWSTHQTFNLSFFRSAMSRDRFLQIFWNLHLCDPAAGAGTPHSTKVQLLLDLLGPKFESAYRLGEFVAVDEAMIAFKGRASFHRYIRSKPHPFGIKAFVLADSKTGYVYRLRLYFGRETDLLEDRSLLQTTRTILTLTQPLEGLGHHVITDRFYSSPELAVELERRGLPFTGTVQTNRRGMPLAVRSSQGLRQLQRGGVRAYQAGKMMALQWRDKRVITILSTSGSCNIVQVRTHRGQLKQNPEVVQLYNDNKLGVDKTDQLAAYYAFLRKSVKWWRKALFWLLEVSVINTYIIYSGRLSRQLGQQPLTHLQYRRSLILGLVSRRLQLQQQPRPGRRVDMSLERLRPIPHFSDEGERWRDCRVCSSSGCRRTTMFYCTTCSDRPHLRPGRCFRTYHTRVNFHSQ